MTFTHVDVHSQTKESGDNISRVHSQTKESGDNETAFTLTFAPDLKVQVILMLLLHFFLSLVVYTVETWKPPWFSPGEIQPSFSTQSLITRRFHIAYSNKNGSAR